MERLPRRFFADLTSWELYQRAAEYRDMAINARGYIIAAALGRLAVRYELLAMDREMDRTASCPNDGTGDHIELVKLIELTNQAASREPNPIRSLITAMRSTAASNADPYLVIGSLLEGAVQTICTRIPSQRMNETAEAVMQLLRDRLQANGITRGAQ